MNRISVFFQGFLIIPTLLKARSYTNWKVTSIGIFNYWTISLELRGADLYNCKFGFCKQSIMKLVLKSKVFPSLTLVLSVVNMEVRLIFWRLRFKLVISQSFLHLFLNWLQFTVYLMGIYLVCAPPTHCSSYISQCFMFQWVKESIRYH